MEYSQETAFKILKAMEAYPDSVVPSPYEPLEEDTGRPAPKPPMELPTGEAIATFVSNPLEKTNQRPAPPKTTDPKSWIGEMDNETFLAHVGWLKQEKFITTTEGNTARPREITMPGVQLLKEVEAKGGWGKALEIASEVKAASTLTSMREALRKAKPKQ